jgi:hypothetical protein
VLKAFFFNLSHGGRGKSSGSFSVVFNIPYTVWSIVSPILGCGVARFRSEASILYLSTIIEMLLDKQYDFIDWLCVPFGWRCLKTPKHAINEDKTLQKFGIRDILNAEYTYIPNDQTCEAINQF